MIIASVSFHPLPSYNHIKEDEKLFIMKRPSVNQIITILSTHKQVFLTGAGGTGKSHLLQQIIKHYKTPAILATTASAAQLIGGDTLHAFFMFGLAQTPLELEAQDNSSIEWAQNNLNLTKESAIAYYDNKLKKRFKNIDLIVIDEVSMVSSETFDCIIKRMQQVKSQAPLLFVGDLYQLPPVCQDRTQTFCFQSKHWNPYVIELTKIHRTNNKDFATAQQHIRQGLYTELVHNQIKKILSNTFNKSFRPTILTSTKKQAETINNNSLASLKTPLITLQAEIKTELQDAKQIKKLINLFPLEPVIQIKEGARIIICKNMQDHDLVNGSQATLLKINLKQNTALIRTDDGREILLAPELFTRKQIKTSPTGIVTWHNIISMYQFPFKCAYALTIHKSQGMSINQLEIDCRGIFEAGQFYVALSRATDPTKIRLLNFNRNYVRISNEQLRIYYNNLKHKELECQEQ